MKDLCRRGVWATIGVLVGVASVRAEIAPKAVNESELPAVEEQIAGNLAQVEHAQTRRAQIDAEISGLAGKREEAEERLHERARALYRIRRAGMLPVAGGFDSLMAHLARVQRLSRIVRADLETMEYLEERGAALRVEKEELAEGLQSAQAALRELETKKETLDRERQSKTLFRDALRGEAPEGPREQAMDYGRIRVSGDMDDLGEGFSDMRGQLALPVQGSMRVGDGEREGASGLEFYGRPGGPVRAAADGRVAFAQSYGAYGLMVILDHGGSFYTVYGGLGTADVQVGDWVGMSTRVGTLDTAGPDAILFFEVRKGTRPLDARSWLGL